MISKVYNILSPQLKISSFFIILLILFGILLEIIGLGLIFPVISTLISEDYLSNKYIANLHKLFGEPKKIQFLIYSIFLLVSMYLIKSILLVFINFKITRFDKNILEYLSTTLFRSYIFRPYEFHININSSLLTKNIISETNNLAFFIGSLIHIFSETILLLSFMLFLFIYNPLLTLILTICFILISLTIYFLTKNQTYKIGAKRQKLDTKRFKLLQFSFGPPIKDIKLLGLEENYSKNYFDAQTKYASITALMLFIQSLPKILFEIIFIFALSSLILILIFLDSSFNEIIMTLSIFGVVGFRLMPSFSKLLTHFNSIRFTKSGVDAIYNEYKKLKDYPIIKSKIEKFSFLKSIELKKIFYNFSRENKNLFNNFNLIIKKGMSIGIIGQSGTGKTTLINLISGLISLKEGEILVDNINIKSNLKGWQKNIGYVSQNVHLNDDTIKKNVAIGLSDEEIDSQKVIEVLSKARLLDFINKQKNQLETVVGERGVLVSGGQLQRIGIARALYNNPNLLILDEATSNLDLKTEEEIIKIVNDLKTNNLTVIIVSHRTSTLKFCDEVINLDNQ